MIDLSELCHHVHIAQGKGFQIHGPRVSRSGTAAGERPRKVHPQEGQRGTETSE